MRRWLTPGGRPALGQALHDPRGAPGLLAQRAVRRGQGRGQDRPEQPVLPRRRQPQRGEHEVPACPRPRWPPGRWQGPSGSYDHPRSRSSQLSEPPWILPCDHSVPGKPIGLSQGRHKALILWHTPSLSLLGSCEPWLSLLQGLPVGGPRSDKATQGWGLAPLTCCCCLANNCTKLAAHKNAPASPPFVTGSRPLRKPDHIAPSPALEAQARAWWAANCRPLPFPGPWRLSPGQCPPSPKVEVQDGGPWSSGSPAWGSAGPGELPRQGQQGWTMAWPLTSPPSALRRQENPAELRGVRPGHWLLAGHVGPGRAHPGRGAGRIGHLLVLRGFDAEHNLCQLTSGRRHGEAAGEARPRAWAGRRETGPGGRMWRGCCGAPGSGRAGACIADGDRGLVPGPQGKDQLSREGRRALPWWLPASCSNMPASPLGRGGSAPPHLALSFIKWVLRCIWAALCRGPGTGGAWDGRSS